MYKGSATTGASVRLMLWRRLFSCWVRLLGVAEGGHSYLSVGVPADQADIRVDYSPWRIRGTAWTNREPDDVRSIDSGEPGRGNCCYSRIRPMMKGLRDGVMVVW